jgi:hypothetical protein
MLAAAQVCSIVVQTMIATEPALSSATRSARGANLLRSCFEVFGFDVLLDTQLRAWLLEVNTCPALNADSPLDMAVKINMVSDGCGMVAVARGGACAASVTCAVPGTRRHMATRELSIIDCCMLKVCKFCWKRLRGCTGLSGCRWLTYWA